MLTIAAITEGMEGKLLLEEVGFWYLDFINTGGLTMADDTG